MQWGSPCPTTSSTTRTASSTPRRACRSSCRWGELTRPAHLHHSTVPYSSRPPPPPLGGGEVRHGEAYFAQPRPFARGEPRRLATTHAVQVGEWSLDKRHYMGGGPPLNLAAPPTCAHDRAFVLRALWNNASATLAAAAADGGKGHGWGFGRDGDLTRYNHWDYRDHPLRASAAAARLLGTGPWRLSGKSGTSAPFRIDGLYLMANGWLTSRKGHGRWGLRAKPGGGWAADLVVLQVVIGSEGHVWPQPGCVQLRPLVSYTHRHRCAAWASLCCGRPLARRAGASPATPAYLPGSRCAGSSTPARRRWRRGARRCARPPTRSRCASRVAARTAAWPGGARSSCCARACCRWTAGLRCPLCRAAARSGP